ncbi:DUF3234 domain-containing protein [Thermus thermamylovorans]|uniref:DUF3234 domain-containing protein n=1 Tax=Thermus thermamylovorans TaxID=2509362 RepID=A0A4Q9B6E1_9DEIN|nr:DUF3234 domain-containing protein [Thermus thermamylovorans]TBH21695.1 DUF3234 domain-containing protein [Thermus thermamylovorans]
MEPELSGTWYVLEGEPGEHLVMEALGQRLSGIWTSEALAQGFLARHPRLGMRVSPLESPALKEAFLRALGMLRVEGVLVDYEPGAHRARMARVEELLREVRRA